MKIRSKDQSAPNQNERWFSYFGLDSSGAEVKGKLKAKSYNEAKYAIEKQGLSNIEFKEIRPWYLLEFGRAVPLKLLLQSTRQLASFAQAGIPVLRGIEILARNSEHPRLRDVFSEIQTEIEGGSNFSEAVSHHPNVFPKYYSAILSSSEKSGDLPGALSSLNSYLDRDLKSSRAVRSAMNYPIVLITLTFSAMILLALFVLPRFKDFFSQLDAKLPLTTRIMLGSTDFIKHYYPILIAIGLLLLGAYFFIASSKKGQMLIDRVKFRMPILGGLFKLIAVERFCRVLATLVKAQVPLPESMVVSAKATGSPLFVDKIEIAKESVMRGEGLAAPLAESKIFPTVAVQIFEIGEESGQLESQLGQAANFYGDELDHRIKTFTSLIEPVVLIVVGGGIGFMSMALISAMYGIFQAVQP